MTTVVSWAQLRQSLYSACLPYMQFTDPTRMTWLTKMSPGQPNRGLHPCYMSPVCTGPYGNLTLSPPTTDGVFLEWKVPIVDQVTGFVGHGHVSIFETGWTTGRQFHITMLRQARPGVVEDMGKMYYTMRRRFDVQTQSYIWSAIPGQDRFRDAASRNLHFIVLTGFMTLFDTVFHAAAHRL